jgi:hypothetical protein
MKIQVGASTPLGYRPRGKTAIRRSRPEGAALTGERSGAQSFEKRLNEEVAILTRRGGEPSPRIMIGAADQCLDAALNRLSAYAASARFLPLAAAFVLFAARFYQVRF